MFVRPSQIECISWTFERPVLTSPTRRLRLVAFDFPSLAGQAGIRPSRVDHDDRALASRQVAVSRAKDGTSSSFKVQTKMYGAEAKQIRSTEQGRTAAN